MSMRSLLLLLMLFSGGCATLPHDDVRHEFLQGRPEAALATLEKEEISRRDALLALMERGLILHNMGKYEQSAKAFLKAERLLDEWDYISVSEQAKTLVVNEWAGIYKGEYAERLWIHSYQMMNYLLLGDYEDAAVEARLALKVLDAYETPLKKALFTRALIGLSFESAGKYNDAFIEYKKLAEQLPSERLIARQLYWTALRSGIVAEADKYRKLLGTTKMKSDPEQMAEVVVFIAHGVMPRKVPADIFIAPDVRLSFPQYPPTDIFKPRYSVIEKGERLQFEEVTTLLPDVARDSLHARGKALLAKQAARASIKHNIAHEVGKENELAGSLLKLAFLILEEADTRSWSTLPETLSLLRIPLSPGRHHISIESSGIGAQGKPILELKALELKPGERIYRKIRF